MIETHSCTTSPFSAHLHNAHTLIWNLKLYLPEMKERDVRVFYYCDKRPAHIKVSAGSKTMLLRKWIGEDLFAPDSMWGQLSRQWWSAIHSGKLSKNLLNTRLMMSYDAQDNQHNLNIYLDWTFPSSSQKVLEPLQIRNPDRAIARIYNNTIPQLNVYTSDGSAYWNPLGKVTDIGKHKGTRRVAKVLASDISFLLGLSQAIYVGFNSNYISQSEKMVQRWKVQMWK